METPLAEFIALTSYSASRRKIADGIPQGVMEKIIYIANKNLNLKIPNLEIAISVKGSQSKYLISHLAISPEPLDLKKFFSKYFSKTIMANMLLFKHTPEFEKKQDILCEKEYIEKYETAINELLDIWSLKGKLENLIYVSILGLRDGGALHLVGDLEIALKHMQDFYFQKLHLPDSFKRKINPKKTLGDIKYALRMFDEKLNMLKNASKFRERLMSNQSSMVRNKILRTAPNFPEGSYLLELFVQLRNFIRDFCIGLIDCYSKIRIRKRVQAQKELPLYEEQIDEVLRNKLTKLRIVTNKDVFALEKFDRERLFDELILEIEKYFRALIAYYDEGYFARNEIKLPSEKINMFLVYFDIKSSTPIQQLSYLDQTKKPEYDKWFTTMLSIAKNWFILFGGKISSRKESTGDKIVGYFNNQINALYASSMVAYHLDMMDQINREPFSFRAKLALGQGDVYETGLQEQGIIINQLAHIVEKSVELDAPDFAGSDVRIIQTFYDSNKPIYEKYAIENKKVLSEDKIVALFIDHRKVVKLFLERLEESIK